MPSFVIEDAVPPEGEFPEFEGEGLLEPPQLVRLNPAIKEKKNVALRLRMVTDIPGTMLPEL
jgi:hypothetical protein